MRVTSLISPNGLGHYRRSIGLLDRLCDRVPGIDVTVLCEDSQVERAAFWERSRSFWTRNHVRRFSGLLPGVKWPLKVDGELIHWGDRLGDMREIATADVVISDNLAGILAVRPDAVLLGSFLWSDILAAAYPDDESVRAFVEHERNLLAAHRPPMLCVGDVAMPGVLAQTQAVKLPWMCEHAPVRGERSTQKRVAVIGGATGAADAMLSRIVRALASTCEVASAPHLGAPIPFDFAPHELASLDVVVCRPGVGTVTDCVAQRVPMVVASETADNIELSHNARCLVALGVARDAGAAPDDESVVRAVTEVLDDRVGDQMRERLAALSCNGLDRAIDELVTRYGVS